MSTANKPRKQAAPAANDPNTPQYCVKGSRHYINGKRYEVGEVVWYEGKPGTGLEPLNDAAKAAVEAAKPKPGKAAAKVDPKAGEF